jgi:hypothetical protein
MRLSSVARVAVLAEHESTAPGRSETSPMRQQLMLTVAAAMLLATAQTAEAASLLPGTYNAVSPATHQPARIGNELVIARTSANGLSFGLNAIRISDKNTGYIAGSIEDKANVVWIDSGNGVRCRLRFVAAPPAQIRVTQDTRFGDCGFGYGVVADGLYVRTRNSGKIAPWNGP